jgi:cell division protein FtsW (lipid II flippase)
MTAVPNVDAVRPRGAERAIALTRGRRGTELAMIVFAIGIMAFAYVSVGVGMSGHVPSGLGLYVGGFAVLILIAHVAVRKLTPWADPLLVPLAAVLNGLGIVMIYRLQEIGRNGNPGTPITTLTGHDAAHQLMWTAFGIVAFVAVLWFVREARVLQRYTYTLGLVGIILLAIPALLPGSISSVPGAVDAKIWIRLGSFSIQPGEFAKIALAVFFAGYLVSKRDVLSLAGRRFLGIDLPRSRDLGPILVLWGVSLLILIFESDIGTSAIFFGLFVAMLYIATQRKSWLIIGFGLFLAAAGIAAVIIPHVSQRFDVWLHPFTAPNGYQLIVGLEGMAYGGIFGTGLGQGSPGLTPLVQSDFIFTGFGEELGLVGAMALLLIFGLLVQRGLRAALAVRDPFSKLLAGGLAFIFALQVFVIVGGVTELIPLTGVTTPFLSQGGSSLVASWMMIALLMRISDTARKPAPQPIQDEGMTQVVRAV